MMIWRSLSPETLANVLAFAIERRGRSRSAEKAADTAGTSDFSPAPVDAASNGGPAGMTDRAAR